MWLAWINKATGNPDRIFMEGEPTPEFSEKTHQLITLDDAQLEEAKAGKAYDLQAKRLVDAPAVDVAIEEAATEKVASDAAAAWLKRMPPGALELLARRVADLLSQKTVRGEP